MPGELTLEQLLMQGVGETSDTDENTEDTNVKKETPPITDEMDVNSLLSDKEDEEDKDEDTDKPDKGEKDKDESKETNSETPDSSENTESNEDDESQVPFPLAFARYQLEQGNFTDLNEEELLEVIKNEGDAAALSYLQNREIERARNELLETYEDDVKDYLDMLDSGVDPETAKTISKSKSYYDKINTDELEQEDKEDLRKSLMTEYYKLTTRFSDVKIKKEIENKIALGEDIEFAKEALPEIKDYYKQAGEDEKKKLEQQRLDNDKATKQRMEEFNKKIEDLQEVVPGIKLNKGEKNKIKDIITKPVKEVNGVPLNSLWAKRSEDPDKFDTVLATLYHYGVFDGKWDKVVKANKSKAAEEIEKAMKGGSADFKSGFSRTKTSPSKDNKDTASLDSMKKAFGSFGT